MIHIGNHSSQPSRFSRQWWLGGLRNFLFVAVVALLIEEGSPTPWQTALGVVFIAGVLFVLLSLFGIREMLLDTISPSIRNAIAVGIGLFIAFIGLQWGGLVVPSAATCVKLDPHFTSPDLMGAFRTL